MLFKEINFSEEEFSEMARLYTSGISLRNIGKEFGISPNTVRSKLDKLGVPIALYKIEFTEEQIDDMEKRYLDNQTLAQIGVVYGVVADTIKKSLRRRGTPMRRSGWAELNHTNIPKNEVEFICDRYKEGWSLLEIATTIKHSSPGCKRVLKGCGIEVKNSVRKYKVNESYFDVIDTEEKAYWLGFLTADGCVQARELGVSIHLQRGDIKHLEKFRDCLESDHPIREFENTCDILGTGNDKLHKMCGIHVYSIKIAASLIKLGVVPRKSLIAKPCINIPEELMRHYWRGEIDGDGWLCVGKNKSTGVCGAIDVVQGYKDFLIKNGIETEAKVRKRENIYSFTIGGRLLVKDAADLLYKDSNIYLDRKYKRYLKLCKEFEDRA